MTRASTPASRSTSPTGWPSSSETRQPQPKERRGRALLPLVVPAVVGTVALLVVTRRGAYVSPDALSYIGTARNLVDGNGYTPPPGAPPIANFPPLYPLLLAAFGALGPDPLTVARVLNPVLFGATILAAGLLVRHMTGSMGLALAGQLLLVSATDLVAYHSSALSEPLFLLLTVLTLAVVAAAVRDPRPALVVAAALLAGAACLTRYLGLTLVLAGAAGLAALGARARWKSAVVFAAVAVAPLAVWLAWLAGTEGGASNRKAVFHAPDADYVVDGLRSASTWILPVEVPWGLRLAAAALVVTALVAAAHRRRREAAGGRDGGGCEARLLALFAAVYPVALVADRTLFDVTGRLDARFLLPLHVVAVVLALRVLATTGHDRSAIGRTMLSALVGLQLAAGAVWVYDAATDTAVRPGGFTAPAWKRSAVIEQVRALSPSAVVFTNQVDALHFHTGRQASPLPEKAAFLTGETKPDYPAQLRAMVDALGEDGLVVYFTAPPARRAFLPTPSELAAGLGLQAVTTDEIGVVYRRPAAGRGPGS